MKRSADFFDAAQENPEKRLAIECGICYDPFETDPTFTRCCKQPIHKTCHRTCRRMCGITCPFCRNSPSKESLLAEILIQTKPGSVVFTKTERLFENFRRHRMAADPLHACVTCCRFSKLQLILSDRLKRDPTNPEVQAAFDRLSAIMPIPL